MAINLLKKLIDKYLIKEIRKVIDSGNSDKQF